MPLIGRALQTEPIATPGEFPDGTGGAGIVKAPYIGANTEQLRTIGIQEQAAREEAKKREAAERAEMEACPASECGPWPEGRAEGGEEGEVPVDPVEENIYTWKYTMEFAKVLREEADELSVDAALGVFVPYIGDFIAGGLEGAANLYRSWAKNLENCAMTVKNFKPKGMCWIYTKTVDLKIGEVYTSIKETPCPWKSGHKAGLEWFDCGKKGEWQG